MMREVTEGGHYYYSSDEESYDPDSGEALDAGVGEGEYYEIEDEILNRLSIEAVLARLSPDDREMIHLWYCYRNPEDYKGPWPPTSEDVAEYLWQRKVRDRLARVCGTRPHRRVRSARAYLAPQPLAIRTVQHRHARVVALWERLRGDESTRRAA